MNVAAPARTTHPFSRINVSVISAIDVNAVCLFCAHSSNTRSANDSRPASMSTRTCHMCFQQARF